MTEPATTGQIKVLLAGISQMTGVRFRYKKWAKRFGPRCYGVERWYKNNWWARSCKGYETLEELREATLHWYNLACEIENEEHHKENRAREEEYEKRNSARVYPP